MLKQKISIFFLLVSQIIVAQNVKKCNTTFLMDNEIQENEEYLENRKKIIIEDKLWIDQNYTTSHKRSSIIIPIVVHVIYRTNHANIGSGTNISDARIEDAIRVLNEDYSKTNPEFPNPPRNTFLNSSGNPNLEFCFATIDPNGNSTTGVTRTVSTKTNFDPDTEANDMKRNNTGGKDGWDPSKYLNIWICDLAVSASGGMTLGYAYLPGLPSGGWGGDQTWKDGLVVDFQWFGTIQGASGDSRTATHEIGHYLGLNHTFCESQSGGCCDNDNNNVDDTPATDGVYWGSVNNTTNNNTCNDLSYGFSSDLLDMDENYMSYSQNTWMFTNSQVNAMNATLFGNGYRSSLINSNVTVNCSGTIGTVGINNLLDNNQINIYPNPTEGKILIQNLMQASNNSIVIRNILGETILTSDNKNSLVSLDLSHLENGIYFIEVSSSKGIRIEKVILAK